MDPRPLPRSFQPPPPPSSSTSASGSAARPHVNAPSTTRPPIISAVNNSNHASSDTDTASKRRRVSSITSRGVANLTPDQLAKKRANDREAQRAIRERTKSQIETLERKIQELSSQQPHKELQTILKQKQLVENENINIKQKLKAAMLLLQPLLGSQGGSIAGSSLDPGRDPHPLPQTISQFSDTASLRSSVSASPTFGTASPAQHASPISSAPTYTSQPMYPPESPVTNEQRNGLTSGMNMASPHDRLNLGFLLDGQTSRQTSNSPHHSHHRPPTFSHIPTTNIPPPSPAASQPPKPPDTFDNPPLFAHTVPVRNIPPTCPFDKILLDFLADRRARAAEGASPSSLIGPAYPSVSSLLHPERSIYAHPLSKVFTDILATFPDLSRLPEQVAVLYVMFLIMRWQISPTEENYERLPEWVTPRLSQVVESHPAWVDHLPWPRMRDRMCSLWREIPLGEFFVPFTRTLSLNWPGQDSETLVRGEGAGAGGEDDVTINPVFERHLRDLGNWTLGMAFEKAFPMLADTCRIKREDGRK
ncbi:MAG: hypothetical protein Q9220_007002 [cf. Caloplaca sp. 1 TL-2023]